ncbi:MAG: NAD(P)/FAD-dependent oxidoreductase [Chloroflexi bacterium]|nr:NAD(P)/FAD-dependent oxidoreductase [Chloroflexota bacterium]
MALQHLIIGNGPAGMTAAEEIRARDPQAGIRIVSNEPHLMYSRPGLAYLLMGEISEPRIFARTQKHYAEQRIHLLHGHVTAFDLLNQRVQLGDGNILGYDRLLLATGASAVPATFPGSELDGVVYLDTLKNVQDILRRVDQGARAAVVVGGGITAMEMAEGLRHRGLEVHYFLRKKTIWSALLTDDEARIIEDHARAQKIHIHYNSEIKEILGKNGHVTNVVTTGGEDIACDLVGAGIGVKPKTQLAKAAGIKVDRGIVVDKYLETSAPGVFAAGDVAQVFDQWTGESRVDDLWSSAQHAGRAAGANMTGVRVPYIKGAPFNAALIFGVHITSIGQAGAGRHDKEDANETLQYQSRGSSEVFWAHDGKSYSSAWSRNGDNSLRLVLNNDQIVGALILGNQDLADPLRDLIGQRADISPIRSQLQTNDPSLPTTIREFWERWRKSDHTISRALRLARQVSPVSVN